MDRQIVDPEPGKKLQHGNLRWRPAIQNGKKKYTLQSSKS